MAAPLAPILREAVRGRVADPEAVLGAWREALSDASTKTSSLLAAPAVSRALRRAGAPGPALELCHAAAPHVTGPELQATLGQARLLAAMALGQQVPPAEVQAAAALLAERSDERWAKGQREDAARLVNLAWELLLDRSLHTETTTSPLPADPAGWVEAVRGTQVVRWLDGSPARRTLRRLRPRPRRRVRRVMLVTTSGSHFLDQPRTAAAAAGVELREVVLTELQTGDWRLPRGPALASQRVAARLGTPPEVPPALREGYAWADQVLVDWCDDAAAFVSATAPPGPEVVVRLHSVEALSVHPHFVTWERVDRLLFVAGHVAGLMRALLPVTAQVRGGLLPPHAPLRPLTGPLPPPGPSHVMALVGWSQPVKDPVWALDVLAALRAQDPRWRLLLVGRDQFDGPSTRETLNGYAEAFHARAELPDVAGAVDRLPWLDDITTLGEHARVILSSSVREGFAVGLHEAVEGGLLPVVRRWPLMAPFGAPGETCADEWVVDTVEEAAERILRHHDDEPARERAWHWLDATLGARACAQAYRRELRWPVPLPPTD